MLERLTPARRNLALAALGVLVLWFAWTVRSVLNPLLLGYLLAYIVHPLVLKLEHRGWSRRAAVNAIFVGAGLGGVVLSLGLLVQGRGLALRLAGSDIIAAAGAELEGLAQRALELVRREDGEHENGGAGSDGEGDVQGTGADGSQGGAGADGEQESDPTAGDPASTGDATLPVAAPATPPPEDLRFGDLAREFWSQLTAEQAGAAGRAAIAGAGGVWSVLSAWFGSLLAFGTMLILLPVYTYFLLFDLGRIHGFVRRYLPIRDRARLAGVGRDLGAVLANFFRGRMLVCLFKGLFLTLALWVLGVDYALFLGLGSGFLALVPFVGAALGFLGTCLVGLGLLDMDPLGLLVRLSIVFGLAELFEGYVLIPKILGDSLGLHPVVVIASVMVGGAALGMFGFLIALPLTAALTLLSREFVLPALADFADEDDSVGPPEPEVRGETAGG